MREQIPAFPPCAQRRKTFIGFGRKEFEIKGAAFQLSRKWAVCTSVEKCRDQRVEKKRNGSLSSSVDEMKEGGDMEGEVTKPAGGAEGADRGRDMAENAGSPARDTLVLLQWGHSKRPRCSRTDNSNHHVPKNGSVADESSHVLLTRRAKASPATQSPARAKINGNSNSSRIACSKDEAEAEERGGGDDDDDEEEDGGRKRTRGSVVEAGRAQRTSNPSHSKSHRRGGAEEESKTLTASSPSPPAPTQILHQSLKLELPKVIICLSRKEKEDDFFLIRGTKLPHRPKRRPKVVEKFLHYCSPGSWLAELSHGRYDVREKKCVKKKPRGLKAMESSESDSE